MNSTDIAARNDLAAPTFAPPGPAAVRGAAADVGRPVTRWSLPTRIGFRFFTTYFFLYVISTQMLRGLLGPVLSILPFSLQPFGFTRTGQAFEAYIAVKWFGFSEPLSRNLGAGDKPVDYALAAGLLVIAAVVTLVWSAIDWKRPSYPRLYAWSRVFLRFSLAGSMLTYGWIKAFPLQMSFPSLTRMLEPYGHFTLMAVLWSKIGSSTAYEMFTGCAELLAGVLLMIPGLSTLGALIAIPVTFQVWMLNMTYDVPVKLFSLHLVVMSGFLLLPDLRRLVRFLVLKRATDPPREPRLFRRPLLQGIAVIAQVFFAAWLMWAGYSQNKASYNTRWGAPPPPLYGIWNIDRMYIDGVERAPLLTDWERWRRIVVQAPGAMMFQRMNDTWAGFAATADLTAKTVVFTVVANPQAAAANPGGSANVQRKEIGRFTIEQPTPEQLVLDGTLNGRKMRMETSYFDPDKLRLRAAKFQWMQDRPWNVSSADYAWPQLR